jgi:hypothetical protein
VRSPLCDRVSENFSIAREFDQALGSVHKAGSLNTAEGRARRIVRRFATHYGLSRTSTLRGDPTDYSLAVDFNRFLDRLNNASGQVLWLAIPEYDKRGLEHIHLLTHPLLDVKLLRRTWTSTFDNPTRRHFWSKQMSSVEDVRKHANYLTKTFYLPADSRPSRRRYRNSKHPLPKPIVFRDVTQAEIEVLSERIVDLTGSQMNTWKSDNYWYPEIRTWSPTIDTTTELENFLNLYKPL